MSQQNENNQANSRFDKALEWIEDIILYVFIVLLIFIFLIRIVVVDGKSMMNTLYDEDIVIVSQFLYEPEINDIVVLEPDFIDKTYVKRIIALEGQTVLIDYNNQTLTVDGKVIEENYIKDSMRDSKLYFDQKYFDINSGKYVYKVPKGCAFVLGDNRNNSSDSREFGFIRADDIIGKVFLRINSPYGDLGFID